MTAVARITQDDIDRVTKSVARAGFERARIRMDLNESVIEIIIGDEPEPTIEEEWSDDD